MEAMVRLGQNVRALRTKMGISQEELGYRAGIHRTYVSGLERGIRNATLSVLCKLARELGCDPADLLEGIKAE